jgi:hypothetical protein
MISYFKLREPTLGKFVDPPQDFEALQHFLSALEYQLNQHSPQPSDTTDTELQSVAASQDDRRQEWLDFKHAGSRDFAVLKRIASRCEDWQHEIDVFEAAWAVKSLEREGNAEGGDIVTLEQFMNTLSTRIDAEIDVDIQFQDLVQRFISQDEQLDKVDLILKQLALARNRKDSADIVADLKQRFVSQTSKLLADAAEIIPLFRKR